MAMLVAHAGHGNHGLPMLREHIMRANVNVVLVTDSTESMLLEEVFGEAVEEIEFVLPQPEHSSLDLAGMFAQEIHMLRSEIHALVVISTPTARCPFYCDPCSKYTCAGRVLFAWNAYQPRPPTDLFEKPSHSGKVFVFLKYGTVTI